MMGIGFENELLVSEDYSAEFIVHDQFSAIQVQERLETTSRIQSSRSIDIASIAYESPTTRHDDLARDCPRPNVFDTTTKLATYV